MTRFAPCTRSVLFVLALAVMLLITGCSRLSAPSGFVATHIDRHITGSSQFPTAVDPDRVGTYPPETKSGAGYFYDDVLEYRVWLHPEKGATPLNGTNDYFATFAQYEAAEEFSKSISGAEPPLVLVRQREWIDEPQKGWFVPRQGDRTTEWQVEWLRDSRRSGASISEFLKNSHEAP